MTAPTYLEHLVHLGKSSGISTFSGAETPSPENMVDTLSLTSKSMPPDLRRAKFMNPANAQQFVTIWQGKLVTISHPVLHQVGTTVVVLANATDNMGTPFPVRITQDRFSAT